jgi:hypothetical protein
MAESKLKDSISSNHLRTLDRASERVNSWPQWKREAIQYRGNDTSQSEALKCSGTAVKSKGESA